MSSTKTLKSVKLGYFMQFVFPNIMVLILLIVAIPLSLSIFASFEEASQLYEEMLENVAEQENITENIQLAEKSSVTGGDILAVLVIVVAIGFFVRFSAVLIPLCSSVGGILCFIMALNNPTYDFLKDQWFGLWLWLSVVCFATLYLYVSACMYGKYKEDETYVSGTHLELEFKDEKAIIKEVNEYSGSNNIFLNAFIRIGRMFAIAFAGIFIYIKHIKKLKVSDEEN